MSIPVVCRAAFVTARRLVLTAVLTAAAVLGARSEEPPAVARRQLPRDKLLLRLGPDWERLPVRTVAEWEERRAEIVRGMESVMGTLPDQAVSAAFAASPARRELDVKVEEESDQGSYVRQLITYASEPGSRVPAYLLIPKRLLVQKEPLPAPAVLCLHGTDNVVGHGVVVGVGNRPNRQYGSELAERGYVVLAPNYPLLAKYQPDLKQLGWQSGTLKAVWDNIRGIDLLASLPYVDARRGFGAIGHSLGGHNAIYTAVFDPRITVVVSSCGFDSYLDYYGGDERRWEPEQGWCQTRYMRKLADYKGRLDEIPFDFHEMIGALAPRKMLAIAPTRDGNFRADSVDRIAAAAREVYALYGVPENLKVVHPECEHDFPPEMRRLAYEWLDGALRRE